MDFAVGRFLLTANEPQAAHEQAQNLPNPHGHEVYNTGSFEDKKGRDYPMHAGCRFTAGIGTQVVNGTD
jgi:hypothetical protein